MVNQTFVGTTESQSSLSVNFRTAITGEAVDAAFVGNDFQTVVKLPAASAMYGMDASILADDFSGAIPAESLSGPALPCDDCFTMGAEDHLTEAIRFSAGDDMVGGAGILTGALLAGLLQGARSEKAERRDERDERKRVSLQA